ncbi:MAG TPA: hypothetical protein VEG38_02135 [Acidimicrobiia bacterium]|nr:hypothetical protein [Acidimicrobiia bacterium]
MRRSVLMPVLAVLSACVMPLTATAGSGSGSAGNRAAATEASNAFTLGGAKCNLIGVPAADGSMPVGVGTCPGVRPGGEVQSEIGLCTLNFLFETPNKERFIGTAGHCVLTTDTPVSGENAGEKTWPKGEGPAAKDSSGKRFGEFAYAVLQDPKDFALIRLDPGVEASPEMCNYGGPTGINDEISDGPKVLHYWGNGVGIGTAVPARSAVAYGFPNADHVYAAGVALPGDSGSGVITDDGRAVGVLVTTGVHGIGIDENGVDFGTVGITRIVPQINQAQRALGIKLTMVTVQK